MKMQKKLNVVLAIVIVILVSLVSFGGIFYKSKNEMKNLIPDYKQGTDLKGYRQVVLEPKVADVDTSNSSEDASVSESEDNADENVSETNNVSEDNNTEKTEENVDNKENYKKSVEVFKNRLKTLKIDNFSVACDQETGKIEIKLPENIQTDVILSDLTQKGEFAIKDSKTEEALLTNNDVRTVKVGKTNNAAGASTTYMSVYFNNKGANKFASITKNYQNTVEENTTNETNENVEETNEISNETEEENVVEDENLTSEETNDEESTDDTPSTEVTLCIDDVTMLTTSFDEIIDNGVLSLNLGSSAEQTEEQLYSAYNLAAIIENEALPMEYEIQGNVYVSSVIEENQLKTIIYIEIGIALAIILVLTIKFRIRGLIAGLLSVGYLAILLIVSRYANVVISILGIFAIEICYILNSIYSFIKFSRLGEEKLTEKEEKKIRKEIMRDYILVLIPTLIIAVVCLFTQWSQLLSFGMIMFWGIIISGIYNYTMDKLIK